MPLPLIPLLLGGASLVAGGYGVKKGFDAKEDFDKAESIGDDAKRRHEASFVSLDKEKEKTNFSLEELGKIKVEMFSNQIKYLLDEFNKRKKAGGKLQGFNQVFDKLDLPALEAMVMSSLALEAGLASGAGAASGALIGLGAYGSVGALASASTGTAIAGLSGAAATNATLAWLGGGALSAGGLGIAGGTAVLGGLVAGPAIAITGFTMAAKAEEALSEARAYESKVDKSIAKIDSLKIVLKGVQANAVEMKTVLGELAKVFDQCRKSVEADLSGSFEKLCDVGLALKKVMDTPIMEKDGAATKELSLKLRVVTSGFLRYEG